MFASLSKIFNALASVSAKPERPGYVVNYLWINAEPFEAGIEDDDPQCGIPLEFVDRMIANARRYPDAEFNLWVDPQFWTQSPTLFFLQSHLYSAGCENIRIRDLNEIAEYREDNFYGPESTRPVWHQVDMARLLVTRQSLQSNPDHIAVYSDFDVYDVGLHNRRFNRSLERFGFAIGTTLQVFSRHPENGYFAFRNAENSNELLSRMIRTGYGGSKENGYHERSDVYWQYRRVIDRFFKQGAGNMKDCLIHILPPCGYKMPEHDDYKGISIK